MVQNRHVRSVVEKVLKRVTNFLNDKIVTGKSEQEHLDNHREVFMRLQKIGLRLINKRKCDRSRKHRKGQ